MSRKIKGFELHSSSVWRPWTGAEGVRGRVPGKWHRTLEQGIRQHKQGKEKELRLGRSMCRPYKPQHQIREPSKAFEHREELDLKQEGFGHGAENTLKGYSMGEPCDPALCWFHVSKGNTLGPSCTGLVWRLHELLGVKHCSLAYGNLAHGFVT